MVYNQLESKFTRHITLMMYKLFIGFIIFLNK